MGNGEAPFPCALFPSTAWGHLPSKLRFADEHSVASSIVVMQKLSGQFVPKLRLETRS